MDVTLIRLEQVIAAVWCLAAAWADLAFGDKSTLQPFVSSSLNEILIPQPASRSCFITIFTERYLRHGPSSQVEDPDSVSWTMGGSRWYPPFPQSSNAATTLMKPSPASLQGPHPSAFAQSILSSPNVMTFCHA
ncbi:uncharacterized protein LAESUDRAFT_718908 [Laetiporus sulphureus 93-53]|uniref:Uncharacterized protein n=1 Tax=Laetiporus sulphureus 93-53 TaxID=1314785 RepID=A0A165I5S5_9APHY|nr:uncharacterized protein LAESUDRAFT_718908 [Laetiporus sulphureus 93-53]KZT12629.1 hypothetical protein LAESUDRAFT_718908 [Laetiporus sulphureus 93-53]